MKPYYSEDGITIYHGDCREILPDLSADVLVTDPPFGISFRSGWSLRPIAGDGDTSLRDEALRLWGKRPALVFGRWDRPRPAETVEVLIWDKGEWPGMGDLAFPWGPSHEEIYVLGTGFCGPRMGTVLREHRLTGNTVHPNEKPAEVLRVLISRCPGVSVLDPFAGSGSTLRAAKDLSRQALGIEIEERYCEIAAKRLSQRILPF